jgi:hypothetical protein
MDVDRVNRILGKIDTKLQQTSRDGELLYLNLRRNELEWDKRGQTTARYLKSVLSMKRLQRRGLKVRINFFREQLATAGLLYSR